MRHVDSIWPETESAARELARALERGESPELIQSLHERFLRLDRDWHVAVRAAARNTPEPEPADG